MALNLSKDVCDRSDIKIKKDRRGKVVRINFNSPVYADLCVNDGDNTSFVKPLPDTNCISSWSSHINVYDSHSKKPILKSSFMKARKSKSPDKMRATAEISQIENNHIRITIEKNQYKIKKNRIKPFTIDELYK